MNGLPKLFQMRVQRFAVLIGVVGLVFGAVPAVAQPAHDIGEVSIFAGFKACFTCSGVFVAGRTSDQINADELQGGRPGVEAIPDPVIDRSTKSVRVSYADGEPPRIAVYREGIGCFLLPQGSTIDDADMLPDVTMPFPAGDPADIDWPDGDKLSDSPLPTEVDAEKLKAAVDKAFAPGPDDTYKTIGVVVVLDGRIIAERYRDGFDMHTQYRTWSTAKSITNALVGIMVGRGLLDVDQPAPIPEWKGDPREAITVENLLEMSSGLQSEGSATLTAYFGGINTWEDIVAWPLEVEPGTRWQYSNYDTLLLVRSIKHVLNDEQTYWKLPREALLNKIGMRHTFPEMDPFGNYILSSQVYSTARDLARFGMLYLNDGVWNGERILPEGWVAYSVEPAPAHEKENADDQGYGKQFWLMNSYPGLPSDAYTTAGARGQFSTIVPSRNVVVARTGLDPLDGATWSQEAFVKDILAAIEE